MQVAVVGAGIMGASTALSLADRGHQVTVFEQHPLGHAWGSSHGRSRIVRKAYTDPFYARIMQDAYPLWRRLDARLGGGVLHETGILYFAHAQNPDYDTLTGALRELGVRFSEPERLDGWRFHDRERACVCDDGGWVRADLAVEGTLELAQAQGAEVVRAAAEVSELERRFDRVVVCAGAWAKTRFNLPVQVTLQTFGYLKVPAPVDGPVWINGDGPMVYGFPSEPGQSTVKFGVHISGPEIDPDDLARPVVPGHLAILKDFARERFLDPDPVVLEPASCLYTRTATEDFRWGQAGDRVFWVSPCSGHGFKFGPWMGAQMADLVEGRCTPESQPRFLSA